MFEVQKPTNSLILVTGGTGAVGPRVVQALHAAGYRVRILALEAPGYGLLPEGIELHLGDVTDSGKVKSAMEGSDAVIHLAALLHIMNPPPQLKKRYEEINVGGTAKVAETAFRLGVKRVILFSTIAVYGESAGRVITEDSAPHPDTFYAQTKLKAERIVLDAKRSDGKSLGTVLRLAAVYGSRIKGNYQRLLKALARGRFIPIGPAHNRRTLIYDRDVGRAAVLAVEHPAAEGKIYNVSDGEFHTLGRIIAAMCESLDRNPPHLSLPIEPVRFLAGILEDLAGMAGLNSPICRATVDKYTEDVAVSGERIQRELGFVPQYNLSAGWRETIQEMRCAGAL
jgi:UDP-glucose 4-epimerase